MTESHLSMRKEELALGGQVMASRTVLMIEADTEDTARTRVWLR